MAAKLDKKVFEAPVRGDLLHAVVVAQMASRRAGTHATKNRAMVSGGGRKPFRQKGTGRARAGTTRAAQWAGGGVVFGPQPRSYEQHLPKKIRKASSLESTSCEEPSTRRTFTSTTGKLATGPVWSASSTPLSTARKNSRGTAPLLTLVSNSIPLPGSVGSSSSTTWPY